MNSAKLQDTKSTYRNLLHSYTNNEAAKIEIKELIPFTVAPKTIKYLGINLTKEVKNLYAENYRNLMREIEEDTQKNGKTFHAHGLENQILLKCLYYPKQSTHSMQPLQSNTSLIHRARKNNPKICMEPEKTPNSQSNPGKENQS